MFVPAELVPIFRLTRKAHPYNVHTMQTTDFLDYKTIAKTLRMLTVREDEGDPVDLTL